MPRLLADTTPLRISADFRRLFTGQALASVGSQLSVVAVGLQVYDITGSTLSVGILGVCALVPLVVLGLYGGALVDVHDRRTVALLASLGLWVVAIALLVQAWLGLDSAPLLYALVAVQSAAFAINNPARQAILPRLLPARLIPAANSLQTVAASVAFTVGPLLGAVLVATSGFATAYAIDVVTFTFALWALVRLPPIPPEIDAASSASAAGSTDAADGPPRRAGFASVVEGLRYLATQPNVRMTFFVDLAAMVLAMPRVLFPAIGVVVLGGGAATTGALTAAIAVGSILAGVFSGPLGSVHLQGKAIVFAVLAWGAAIAGFGVVLLLAGRTTPSTVLWGSLVAALLFLVVAGAADGISAIFRQSVLLTATPDSMRGRLQGVFIVVVAGGPRLGDVVLGAQAAWFGEAVAALAGGLACIAVVLLLVRWQPRFLAYDARDPQP